MSLELSWHLLDKLTQNRKSILSNHLSDAYFSLMQEGHDKIQVDL